MEGPPHGAKFPGMFMLYIPFLTQGVRNPWTRHLTKKWRNRQRNHLSCTSGAPKRPFRFFKRMDMVIFQSFPNVKNLETIVQLNQPTIFFEWMFQVPGLHLSGYLMHLVMVLFDKLWGDRLRGYLQCAGADCYWPWEKGRYFFAAKTYMGVDPKIVGEIPPKSSMD